MHNFFLFTAMKSNIGRKKSKSGDRPPKIVSHLNSDFVKDGEPVTLSCRIIGAEKFDVIWLHNNKEIKPIPNEEPKSPVFKTFPQSATLQEGESVSFNCETEKVPLKVTWLKDGKPVDETSSKYQFVQDGKKKFKFEITNCNSLDVGQYTAKAVGANVISNVCWIEIV
uniref:Ig-like domain-containing protein n=1 Tax=Timema douglasi TaxID=61478 RepID=A0A7R8ZGF2_TIMDO|nr:unnamed protein product [Timema douglasi]